VSSIPELFGTGATSNQALAELDRRFDAWYKAQREAGADVGAEWTDIFHGLHALYKHEPESVPGDFWVENDCCTSCGVPQVYAPDLVGWTDEPFATCYWKKQPETVAELEQAFKIFQGQELDCHHYRGKDPAILASIGSRGDRWESGGPLDNLSAIVSAHWGKRTVSEEDERHSWWARLFGRR
jgi:hypothetical protein